MKLGETLELYDNDLDIKVGEELTEVMCKFLKAQGIQGIYIEDEISHHIHVTEIFPTRYRLEIFNALQHKDYDRVMEYSNYLTNHMLSQKEFLLKNGINHAEIKTQSHHTEQHEISVCIYATGLAIAAGLSTDDVKVVTDAAILHDIGKDMVPHHIIEKRGKLTNKEILIIRQHPQIAYSALKEISTMNEKSKTAILHHHENIDGSGYYGIKGDALSIYSRILRITDVYDAMASKRVYRNKAFNQHEIFQYMKENSGLLFDSDLLDIFMKIMPPYLVGQTIQLSNNEMAVIESIQENHTRPTVRLFNGNTINMNRNKLYAGISISNFI